MKTEILTTQDGSTTIHLPDWNESYHSKHGAIQEARHVFIKNGLELFVSQNSINKVSILEIGFGTGLNALVTYLEAEKSGLSVDYVGVEAFPVALSEALQMNYPKQLQAASANEAFRAMHGSDWETPMQIAPFFRLAKQQRQFEHIDDQGLYNLIYFDAFGFRVQPELWSEAIFARMFAALKNHGVLVTYACRTSIRLAMQSAGFTVEKLPGAPGKREMLRATKNI